MSTTIRPIAIHLPQFHPFTENDLWWGKGFTEWTNVTKAKPLFKGHYQPHLPADLGFYDLRLEEARMAQIELAKQYGIYGFCYYHYWFNGKRLLHQPLDRMLANPNEDFPFILCWANENWTRRWDGEDKEILMKQNYSEEDDRKHIQFLIEHFFSDERYIKVDGKPFFIVYRPNHFPDIRATLDVWRNEASKAGMGLHLGFMKNFPFDSNLNKDYYGFDCMIEFQPELYEFITQEFPPMIDKIKHRLNIKRTPYYDNYILPYATYVDKMVNRPFTYNSKILPGITPGWDNSARRKRNAIIFKDSTPAEYRRWLEKIKEQYQNKDTFLFINAWNEWAEGNHLEPCSKWGRQYLEQTKLALIDT